MKLILLGGTDVNTFKEAWMLLKFEYKMTPPTYVPGLMMLALLLFLVVGKFTELEEQTTLGTEMLFISVVIFSPYFARSEQVKSRNIGNKKHASSIVAFLQTLPVSNKVIATYRMTSFTILTVFINSVFFTFLYVFTPYLRSIAPLSTYIVFVLMWICFAIYAGGSQVQYEAGFHYLINLLIALFIVIPLLMFLSIVLFYKTYTHGLIQWMLDVSTDYPLIVTSASIVLAVGGYVFHIRRFMKRMDKTDY